MKKNRKNLTMSLQDQVRLIYDVNKPKEEKKF